MSNLTLDEEAQNAKLDTDQDGEPNGTGYSGPLLKRGLALMNALEVKDSPPVLYEKKWAWGKEGADESSLNHKGNAWTIEAARAAIWGTPKQLADAKKVLIEAYYPRELRRGIWTAEMLSPDNHTHQQLSATGMGRLAARISKDPDLLDLSGQLLRATAAMLKKLASPKPDYFVGSPGMRSPGQPHWYWGTAWLRLLMGHEKPMPKSEKPKWWTVPDALAVRVLRYLQRQGDDLGGAAAATDISKSKLKYKVTVYRGKDQRGKGLHLAMIEKPAGKPPGKVCDWVQFFWEDNYEACEASMRYGLNWNPETPPPAPPPGAKPIRFPTAR